MNFITDLLLCQGGETPLGSRLVYRRRGDTASVYRSQGVLRCDRLRLTQQADCDPDSVIVSNPSGVGVRDYATVNLIKILQD